MRAAPSSRAGAEVAGGLLGGAGGRTARVPPPPRACAAGALLLDVAGTAMPPGASALIVAGAGPPLRLDDEACRGGGGGGGGGPHHPEQKRCVCCVCGAEAGGRATVGRSRSCASGGKDAMAGTDYLTETKRANGCAWSERRAGGRALGMGVRWRAPPPPPGAARDADLSSAPLFLPRLRKQLMEPARAIVLHTPADRPALSFYRQL